MKFLLALTVVAVCLQAFQAASVSNVRDWSKIKTRRPLVAKSADLVQDVEKPMSFPKPTNTKSFAGVCGKSNPAKTKIVGGNLAGAHEFPWQVALFITVGTDTYFCGGTLISDEWVLTAAHCADGASSFEILIGAQNVRATDAEEPDRITLVSTDFTIHPNWNSLLVRNDLSLIRLPQKVALSSIIAPNCLPPAGEVNQHAGESAVASGWGLSSDAATSISEELRKVTVPIISNTECRAVYGITVTATTICTSGNNGMGTCSGDSGGPLSVVGADGTFTQVGIVSYGASAGCEKGYPDAFTRVTEYVTWISSVTQIAV